MGLMSGQNFDTKWAAILARSRIRGTEAKKEVRCEDPRTTMVQEPIFIVDIGSSSVKVGYNGEDTPSYVFM